MPDRRREACGPPGRRWTGYLPYPYPTKNPPVGGFFVGQPVELLQLGFLVHHMLASLGIELADLHFLRHGLLVLGGGVEVAGARSGLQLDLFASAFSHDSTP